MLRFSIVFSILALTGCAHSVLMKCRDFIPGNIYHCKEQVDGDYRLCELPVDNYTCRMPD